MKKRTLFFRNEDPARGQGWSTEGTRLHDYDTASYGWTLTGWTLTDPEQKTHFVEKVGSSGSWDLSTVLTDGMPTYKDRTLTATLECSKGTREERTRLISRMVNLLDGWEWEILLPDHPAQFLKGRVRVTVNQNSLAYAAVTLTATCEPWLYSDRETVVNLTTDNNEWKMTTLWNNGRRSLDPVIEVKGEISLVTLSDYKTQEQVQTKLTTGTHKWAPLFIPPGGSILFYAGIGSIEITYREAVLR